jgi:AcrR family transcriptional regulator
MAMARGSATKERIETEALRLFVERGVAETSIRDIAQAVGVADGALYRHFPSKDALVGHLFSANYTRFAEELERLQGDAPDCRAKLAAMIGGFCRFFDADTVLFRFLLFVQHGQLAKISPEVPTPVDVVRRMLETAMAKGEIAKRDPALATAWVFGIVLQTATAAIYGRLAPPIMPVCNEMVGAAWRSLRAETAS